MSRPTDHGRKSMQRIAELMADDILNASDEEILSELTDAGGDAERLAADMRQQFETTVLKLNKSRLAAAKAGAAGSRPLPRRGWVSDPATARQILREILSRAGVPANLTLAARNEGELSDADVIGMLADLRELGFLPEDDAT